MTSRREVEENSEKVPKVKACPVWLEPSDQGGKSRRYEVREDMEDQFIEVIMKVLVLMLSENRKPVDLTSYLKGSIFY